MFLVNPVKIGTCPTTCWKDSSFCVKRFTTDYIQLFILSLVFTLQEAYLTEWTAMCSLVHFRTPSWKLFYLFSGFDLLFDFKLCIPIVKNSQTPETEGTMFIVEMRCSSFALQTCFVNDELLRWITQAFFQVAKIQMTVL